VLTGNSAGSDGGGAFSSTLNNCTLAGNSAGTSSGGAIWSTLNNCIVYFNTAPTEANYSGSTLNYCCTTPLPAADTSNITLDPQLASATYLSAGSPCHGAGSPAYVSGTDIDGEPWATPPSIGCDEYHAGAVTGPLNMGIVAAFTNVATGYPVSFTALIAGRILQSVWDFGDGTLATNQPFSAHAWGVPGLYTVRLTGYNDSYPGGVSTTVTITVSEVVRYVDAASANPVFPYTSWPTAARNIQDAIEAAGTVPGAVVLVTNGVYRVGKVYFNGINRVALTNIVVVRSANGPELTIIEGETNGVRCASVGNGAVLSGFTLTKGTSAWTGGGVLCEAWAVVTNCTLTGNSASTGGGAWYGTLNNCTFTGNSALERGGGASWGTLNNCTLTGNSAPWGGWGHALQLHRLL
jgi:PKD repeat protein